MKNLSNRLFLALAATTLLIGCELNPFAVAGTGPTGLNLIDADDTVVVRVEAAEPAVVLPEERARFAAETGRRLLKHAAGNALADGTARAWELVLQVRRYEHGNAFKRSVQAGMGAMHIDADVEVFAAGVEARVATFAVSKTYNWGGTLGGQATIADLETMVADAVAKELVKPAPAQKKAPSYLSPR